MSGSQKKSKDFRRVIETIIMMLVVGLLLVLTSLETQVYHLSEKLAKNIEFYYSLIYFGIINFNVIILAFLSFLIIRNLAKLLVERRRGVFGSRLRAKLVLTLVLFATAPTAILYYISTNFITNSFDSWFSSKVTDTMHQTREIGRALYREDQKRIKSLALLATNRVVRISSKEQVFSDIGPPDFKAVLRVVGVKKFKQNFNIDYVSVYDLSKRQIYASDDERPWRVPYVLNDKQYARLFVLDGLINPKKTEENQSSFSSPSLKSTVASYEGVDVVQGVSEIQDKVGNVVGYLIAETKFSSRFLSSVESILAEFATLKPSAQYIKLSFIILLISMCFLIMFSAIWVGFYVARGIIAPIQNLALATKEVALGNYKVELEHEAKDETGLLIDSFNKMTTDLLKQEQEVKVSSLRLKQTNEELGRYSNYVQLLLQNISAGVFSVDEDNNITTFNRAAEKLLGLESVEVLNQSVESAFPVQMLSQFWKPIQKKLKETEMFSGQIDLDVTKDKKLTLLVYSNLISDESGVFRGCLVVFDDATEQVKAQKIAAWKEVARRIAHEIKNPITPIKLNAERLGRKFKGRFDNDDAAVFQSCVDAIIDQADVISHLISEFSKFSRMPSINVNRDDLMGVLNEVVAMYQNSYPMIKIAILSDMEQCFAMIDKPQIKRVVINVINNAIESFDDRHDKANINIKLQYDEKRKIISMEVADNGPGIPDQIQKQVLEPYFSTKKEGTGLGLSIVKQVLIEHGGDFRIKKSGPSGTTVVMILPAT